MSETGEETEMNRHLGVYRRVDKGSPIPRIPVPSWATERGGERAKGEQGRRTVENVSLTCHLSIRRVRVEIKTPTANVINRANENIIFSRTIFPSPLLFSLPLEGDGTTSNKNGGRAKMWNKGGTKRRKMSPPFFVTRPYLSRRGHVYEKRDSTSR